MIGSWASTNSRGLVEALAADVSFDTADEVLELTNSLRRRLGLDVIACPLHSSTMLPRMAVSDPDFLLGYPEQCQVNSSC